MRKRLLQSQARVEAEASLRRQLERAKVVQSHAQDGLAGAEQQAALDELKAAISTYADAAQGSDVLKEVRAVRDKLSDAVRKEKSIKQRKQKEAQRLREDAERKNQEEEARATAAHVAHAVCDSWSWCRPALQALHAACPAPSW